MRWSDIIRKNDATKALLEIIMEDLKVTIPHHIDQSLQLNRMMGLDISDKAMQQIWRDTWENNARTVVGIDSEWTRKFLGSGYTMDEVNWNEISKRVIAEYDRIFDMM